MNIASRTIASRAARCAALGFGLCALFSQAQAQTQDVPPAPYGPYSGSPSSQSSNDYGHNWVPSKPKNPNWQAPARNTANQQARPPQQAPAPAQNYYQGYSQQQPYASPYAQRGYSQPYNPAYNRGYGNYRQPTSGAYGNQPYRPTYGQSYYNRPVYRPRPYPRKKKKNDRKFWGETSPKDLMHPTKENWEQAWDDMMLSPYHAGEMPGGWYAPEVYLPNPVDIGDQFKDNAKDLPEQIRDMDVGNTVEDVD